MYWKSSAGLLPGGDPVDEKPYIAIRGVFDASRSRRKRPKKAFALRRR